MFRIFISIILFILAISGSLSAQLVTTHYGLQEGLPSSETFFGYQDDSNYLWFTTDRGVVKYDGYNFKTFTTNDGLAELVNLKILKDPAGGFVLMGRGSQITIYDDKKFSPFKFNDKIKHLTSQKEYRLDLLDVSEDKILLNDLSQFKRAYYEIDRNTGDVRQLYFNDLKHIYWSTIKNIDLDHLDVEKDTVVLKRYSSGHSDNYLVRVNTSYFHYSVTDNSVQKVELPYKSIFGFTDKNGDIWYCSKGSLFYQSPETSQFEMVLKQEVSSIFEDNDGNIWAMTPGNGIHRIKLNKFIYSLDVPGFRGRIVDIYYNEPFLKIYTVSSNNNYKYYIKDSLIFSEYNRRIYHLNHYTITDSSALNEGFKFHQLDTNLMKLSSIYDYLVLINYKFNENYIVYEKNGDAIIYDHINKKSTTLDIAYTYDFVNIGDIYLFGTTEGLKKGQFDNNGQNFLIADTTYINNRVNDLDESFNNDVWIATLQKGVYRYKNGALQQVVNPFHPFTSINTIEVLDSIAFIGSSTGINKVSYEIVDDSVIITDSEVLGISGGLSPPYVKSLEYYQGHIYMGTLQGIYSFHVDSFRLSDSKPKLYLQGLYQKNKKINSETANSYEFENQNNFFTIKYTGISYAKDPVIPFYRYSFQTGDSTQWIYTQSREINFSDIAPGNYKFAVQCRNNANEWSDTASLLINIHPPFFQTWTFRIGSLLLLGGLIWTFFYVRNRNLKRQQAIKNEILSVQMQSTRSQMNPHFVFNGMNAIQNFIFSNDKEGANRYITTFSSLLRDSLQLANREYISLDREIRFVDRYLSLEKNRFPDKFDYKITVSTDIPEEKVLVPTLMVQTLAENAVKHAFKGMSKKGTINIHYYYNHDQNQLTIKIVDDGIGLLNQSLDQEDDSRFGLNLLKRRIDIYNQRSPDNRTATVNIDYLDAQNKIGTIISLNIPLYEKSH